MTECRNCEEGVQYKHDYSYDSPDGLKPVRCECCAGDWEECVTCTEQEMWEKLQDEDGYAEHTNPYGEIK